MNVNELMLGDWVSRYDNPPHYRVVHMDSLEVGIIHSEAIDDSSLRYCWDDKLEPIPLDADILVKSGFPIVDCDTAHSLVQLDDRNFIWFDTIEFTNQWVQSAREGYYHTVLENVKYVHQLQHILRLLGFEKELVL